MNPAPRPPVKLWIAFAAMCGVIAAETSHQSLAPQSTWIQWVIAVLKVIFGTWLTWFIIFRISRVQLMWGWMWLLGGLLSLLVLILFFFVPHQEPPPPWVLIGGGCMTVCGWLLVFDPQVAAHRSRLKVEEDKRASLRAHKK